MRTAWLVQTRKSDIRRPGEPAGVGLLAGPWGRTSVMAGIGYHELAPWSIGRPIPAPVAAREVSQENLLTDASAHFMDAGTGGQS